MCLKNIQDHMLNDAKTKRQLLKTFKEFNDGVTKRVTGKAVSGIAAKRLLNVALQLRKEHAGSLLKTTRTIRKYVTEKISGKVVTWPPPNHTFMTQHTTL